jgi:hypothetical protein
MRDVIFMSSSFMMSENHLISEARLPITDKIGGIHTSKKKMEKK